MNEAQSQKIIELLESLNARNERLDKRNRSLEIKSYDSETHRMRNSLLLVSLLKFVLVFLGLQNFKFLTLELNVGEGDAFTKVIFILTVIIAYKTVFYFIVVAENRVRKRSSKYEYESRGYDFYILFLPLVVGLFCVGLAWDLVQNCWSWIWNKEYWSTAPCLFGMFCG